MCTRARADMYVRLSVVVGTRPMKEQHLRAGKTCVVFFNLPKWYKFVSVNKDEWVDGYV